jgi:hypothetical protein
MNDLIDRQPAFITSPPYKQRGDCWGKTKSLPAVLDFAVGRKSIELATMINATEITIPIQCRKT